MFSRVVLRRIDPAAAASGRADDIENQPLSPREETAPEMTERSGTGLSRLGIRRPTIPSRFRFSSSTAATSSVASDWPGTQAAGMSGANGHPVQGSPNPSEEYDDGEDSERDSRRESTLPSRYSVVVDLPSTRLHLPGLQRTWTQGSNGPPTARPAEAVLQQRRPQSPACRPHTPPTRQPPTLNVAQIPSVHLQPQTGLGSEDAEGLYPAGDVRSRGLFTAADPAEAQLAELARDGRRRRERSGSDDRSSRRHRRQRREGESSEERSERRQRRRQRRRLRDIDDGDEESSDRPLPKHFLFCFPWIKSRKVRSQILQCFVSGLFLVLLLSVYLALSATRNISNSEFSVLLILIILFATIFFCQGLIRLCLSIFRPKPTEERRRNALPQMYGPGGYAVPRQPIRVLLARDEEAAGIESDATKINPPAYGLWRESVRVDPNRIFWQRNTEAPPTMPEEPEVLPSDHEDEQGSSSSSSAGEEASSSASRSRSGPRPPSYASEDGVSYVIEARPRSTVAGLAPPPLPEIVPLPSPLPVHPSEMGRIATPPSR